MIKLTIVAYIFGDCCEDLILLRFLVEDTIKDKVVDVILGILIPRLLPVFRKAELNFIVFRVKCCIVRLKTQDKPREVVVSPKA